MQLFTWTIWILPRPGNIGISGIKEVRGERGNRGFKGAMRKYGIHGQKDRAGLISIGTDGDWGNYRITGYPGHPGNDGEPGILMPMEILVIKERTLYGFPGLRKVIWIWHKINWKGKHENSENQWFSFKYIRMLLNMNNN